MNCPACAAALEKVGCGGLTVDVCRHGCGGIWFDNFELHRVDEPDEHLGDVLAGFEAHPDLVILRTKRPCPKCAGITMLQHQFSREKAVMVDECPNCGGMWLDGGELAEIRRPAPTPDARKKAAERFLNKKFLEDLAHLKARRAAGRQPEP